jgi:chlorinating enzyme
MYTLIRRWLFRFQISFGYFLVKLKFLTSLLPQQVKNRLPFGWNDQMFWTAFKSGGDKIYVDYCCPMPTPTSYQPKVEVAKPYLLSEEEIKFFYENGYIGPFDLVSSEQMADLKKRFLDTIHNQESQVYSYSQRGFQVKADSEQQKQFAALKMGWRDRYLEIPELMDLFKQPEVTERCAQLLGEDLMVWRSQFFVCPPNGSPTPWHQGSLWLSDDLQECVLQPPDLEELCQLTCWVALTDSTIPKGAVALLPGTQKEIYPLNIRRNLDKNKKELGEGFLVAELDYQVNPEDVRPIEVKAGQFFIFTERVIHGSLKNQTQDARWGASVRVIRPDTIAYTQRMRQQGHSLRVQNITNLKLDKWRAVMIRGEDRFGYNRAVPELNKQKETIYAN